MPAYNGFDGVVENATATETLGLVQSWTADMAVDLSESWGMGQEWKGRKATAKSASGSVEVEWGDTDPHNNLAVGDKITLNLYPGGTATGAAYVSGTVVIATVAHAVNKNGDATKSITWESDGAMSFEVAA